MLRGPRFEAVINMCMGQSGTQSRSSFCRYTYPKSPIESGLDIKDKEKIVPGLGKRCSTVEKLDPGRVRNRYTPTLLAGDIWEGTNMLLFLESGQAGSF